MNYDFYETVLAWWGRLPDEKRPTRFTDDQVVAWVMDFVGLSATAADGWRAQLKIELAIPRVGFKRELFDDGRFWTPTAKLKRFKSKSPTAAPITNNSTRSVYFIQSVDGGPIKIGVTGDVLKRLGELQTGNASRLRLLLVLPGDEDSEAQFHERFADLRIPGGEWFQPGDDLIEFIDERMLELALK